MAELLRYSVGANNQVTFVLQTRTGIEEVKVSEADIKSIVNLQSATPPNKAVEADRLSLLFLDIGDGKKLVLEQPTITQKVGDNEVVFTASSRYKIV